MPYQLLFPVGFCAGIVGTGAWVGYLLRWFPSYPGLLHAETMMGGFVLLIATRVTLAHGGHDLRIERRSPALIAVCVCLLLALCTRLAAPFFGDYFFHLAYAALAWIAAVGCWVFAFGPKFFKARPRPNPPAY